MDHLSVDMLARDAAKVLAARAANPVHFAWTRYVVWPISAVVGVIRSRCIALALRGLLPKKGDLLLINLHGNVYKLELARKAQ